MKLAFFNNTLNHHQVHVADEFYRLLGDKFIYISTAPDSTLNLKGGNNYNSRPYLLHGAESESHHLKAIELARTADICVFGAQSLPYALERARQQNCGLSFELGERWLKKDWLNIFSPRLLKWWISYQSRLRFKPFYKLNASAFASKDHARLHSYIGRCYKWGYFTEIDSEFEIPDGKEASFPETLRLMWCSRFLKWKHPELPIIVASRLKEKRYDFILDMYGSGIQENATKDLVSRLGIEEIVRFHGNIPNFQVIRAMREHHIFLFTSDRHEGWGTVANEAMSNGCVLVGSDAIGSIPYLIKEGENGLIFKSGSADSLEQKICWLINHPKEAHQMRIKALKSMRELWSPRNAAESFLRLADDMQHNRKCNITEGPASQA